MADTHPRVPPGQSLTDKFPVLSVGNPPPFDPAAWTLTLEGLVDRPQVLTWARFQALPRIETLSDFHCVTTWSRLDNHWSGVSFKTIADLATPQSEGKFVTIWCDNEYSTSLTLEDLLEHNVLLADHWKGKPLEPDHGGPLRLIVPKLYAWKSAKWVRGIKFTKRKQLGYWEIRGYHDGADPWREERFSLNW